MEIEEGSFTWLAIDVAVIRESIWIFNHNAFMWPLHMAWTSQSKWYGSERQIDRIATDEFLLNDCFLQQDFINVVALKSK